MRTAQRFARSLTFGRKDIRMPQLRPANRRGKVRALTGNSIIYGVLFLVGYIPGIVTGRIDSSLGELLARYYAEFPLDGSWLSVFLNQISASFLQILFVGLCGFSVFGTGFLSLLFLGRGAFLGFCASAILYQRGLVALGRYWGATCLPGLIVLFISLWLSDYAVQLSRGLFQSVFLGGAPRGQLIANARRLGIRCCIALLLSLLLCLVCSGLTVFLIRFFL